MQRCVVHACTVAFAAIVLASCTASPRNDTQSNAQSRPQSDVRFERVHELKSDEGVFAYSRISPDGRFLAYASESRQSVTMARTTTVVELATRKVLFAERGIDAYFSNDGERMIYLAQQEGALSSVTIRHHETGSITRDVVPTGLGDYYSWAVRDGRDVILTILGNYFYLDGDRGVMPHSTVPVCPGIGGGDRPLISKDGRRITTFVEGTIVVRGLDNCDDIIDTGIEGAKSDFSFDGRYLAMHAPKAGGSGYDLVVVDLIDRTVRNVTASLTGSSFFPNWTEDGRLSFRYDGDDYRGFMFADNVLSAPERPLIQEGRKRSDAGVKWMDVFPETGQPETRVSLVLVWGTWSSHAPDALAEMQRTLDYFAERGSAVSIMMATDPGSREDDVIRMVKDYAITIPRIPLAPDRLTLTHMHNQNPTTLLFVDGKLHSRRLGTQTHDDLKTWAASTGLVK